MRPRPARVAIGGRSAPLLAAAFIVGCSGSGERAVDASAADALDAFDAPVADTAQGACEGVDGGSVTNPPYVDLDITASGFTEHEGRTVFVVTRTGSRGVLGTASATVIGGAFAIHFPKGYQRSEDQDILWLLDADGDGVCNDASGDQTGYVVVNAVDPVGAEAVAVAISDNHVRTAHGADLCNPAMPFGDMFDMNITGIGFDAHEGQTVHLLTRTVNNGAIFGSGAALVAGGGFAFHLRKGFQRFSYQEVLFFVDVDGDGTCTAGTDHPGYTVTPAFNPLQNVPVDLQVMDNHTATSARNADVCVVMNGCQLAP